MLLVCNAKKICWASLILSWLGHFMINFYCFSLHGKLNSSFLSGGKSKKLFTGNNKLWSTKSNFNDSKQLSRRHLERFPRECSNYPSWWKREQNFPRKPARGTFIAIFIAYHPSFAHRNQPTNFCASFSLLKINIAWSMVLGGCFHVGRGQLCGIPALQIN